MTSRMPSLVRPLMRSNATQRALALALCSAFACAGCAGQHVTRARLDGVQWAIEEVTRLGAYRCAPRELALARANLVFARIELGQGDPERAEEHVIVAESNAKAARILSPAARCKQAAVAAPEIARSDAKDSDGDGIPDAKDRCPHEREDWDGHLDADGCNDPDNDGDTIPDAADKCPNEPEDFDGFEDNDGCPDPDNDHDGFEDPADDCPNEAGVAESQGCPRKDYPGVTVTERELRLATSIAFQRGTALIRSVSFPALDVVVRVLTEQRQIKLEIAGHTDSQGNDEHNLKLSQEQADAVLRYFGEHGVDRSRLTARGYGETRPIESNSTSQGRAINRRIELVRTDRAL